MNNTLKIFIHLPIVPVAGSPCPAPFNRPDEHSGAAGGFGGDLHARRRPPRRGMTAVRQNHWTTDTKPPRLGDGPGLARTFFQAAPEKTGGAGKNIPYAQRFRFRHFRRVRATVPRQYPPRRPREPFCRASLQTRENAVFLLIINEVRFRNDCISGGFKGVARGLSQSRFPPPFRILYEAPFRPSGRPGRDGPIKQADGCSGGPSPGPAGRLFCDRVGLETISSRCRFRENRRTPLTP